MKVKAYINSIVSKISTSKNTAKQSRFSFLTSCSEIQPEMEPVEESDRPVNFPPKPIGTGGIGHVTLISKNVVRKTCNYSDRNLAQIVREVCFLSIYDHPQIIPFSSATLDFQSNVNIFMKYQGIDLRQWVMKTKLVDRINFIPHIIYQICTCLMFLEHNNIIHGDLKPANIIFNEKTREIFLIDWGSVCFSKKTRHTCLCTVNYAAPEVLNGGIHLKSDIFSLGLIIRFLISKKFEHVNVQVGNNSRVFTVDSTSGFPTHLANLIRKCDHLLQLNPEFRPSASSIYLWDEFNDIRKEYTCKSISYQKDAQNRWERFTNINIASRKRVIYWIANLVNANCIEVFTLAVKLFDIYMDTVNDDFPSSKLKLIGIACFILTTCVINDYISTRMKSIVCNNEYTQREIKDCCWEVFKTLDFKIYQKTFTGDMMEVNIKVLRHVLSKGSSINKNSRDMRKVYNKYLKICTDRGKLDMTPVNVIRIL